jgi:hypothetical protein
VEHLPGAPTVHRGTWHYFNKRESSTILCLEGSFLFDEKI